MEAGKNPHGKTSGRGAAPRGDIRRMIQRMAYEIYVRRGRMHGRHRADWFEAEKIVKSSLRRS